MAKSIGSPSVDGIKIDDLPVLRKKEKNPFERDSAGNMRGILYCCFVQLIFPYALVDFLYFSIFLLLGVMVFEKKKTVFFLRKIKKKENGGHFAYF